MSNVVGTAFVNCDLLNVRRGPGKSYGVLGTVKRDERLIVTDDKSDRIWYEIQYQNGVGYVDSTYIRYTPGRPARASNPAFSARGRSLGSLGSQSSDSGISSRPASSSGSSRPK